jgi:hypothetical protein
VTALAVLRRRDQERYRAFGILLFFGNIVLLALATGWGRATAIESVYGQYPLRYVLMAVPALLVAYFAWELYAPAKFRAVFPSGLLIGMCLLLPLNTLNGLDWLYWFPDRDKALEQDLRAGASAEVLAERYQGLLLHWVEPDEIAGYMRILRDAAIGPFADMAMVPRSSDVTQAVSSAQGPAQLAASPIDSLGAAIQEIRYRESGASQVYLVWGIDGWQLAPQELFPPGTVVKGNLMHTPMVRVGDAFATKIRVPRGTKIDYGFLVPPQQGLAELIWPVWPAWDWNGDQGYQTVVSNNSITELHAPQTLTGYLFSIDFGRFLFFAIGIIFGVSIAIARISQMIGSQ